MENNRSEKIMGPWAYVGLRILYAIPVIGLIFLIIFTFSSGNINRRNFTRSYWCWILVALIIFALLFVLLNYTHVFDGIREPLAQAFMEQGKSGEVFAEFLVPGITSRTEPEEETIPETEISGAEIFLQETEPVPTATPAA